MSVSRFYIRNLGAKPILESFFVSAITSIIIIRVYLTLTHFPQIGGASLHISHMLFGGFFMLLAVLLKIMYLNTSFDRGIAILGGLGFGTFIDELGKFITKDNNYFYQPTFALIYIIFVILYLSFQYFGKFRNVSQEEYLINSLDVLKEAVMNDLDPYEKRIALLYLSKADPKNPITEATLGLIKTLEAAPLHSSNFFFQTNMALRHAYKSVARKKIFLNLLILFFIAQSLITFFISLSLILASTGFTFFSSSPTHLTRLTLSQTSQLVSSIISGALVVLGVFQIRKSQLIALRTFKRAILISILITQIFVFYISQTTAIVLLVFNILILITLNYMIDQER